MLKHTVPAGKIFLFSNSSSLKSSHPCKVRKYASLMKKFVLNCSLKINSFKSSDEDSDIKLNSEYCKTSNKCEKHTTV